MKQRLLILLMICMVSCTQKKNTETNAANETLTEVKHKNFDWLLGKWQRINEVEGKETFENWAKIDATTYEGTGFTIQHGDTIFQENMRLVTSGPQWELQVSLPNEQQPTLFKGKSYSETEFSCENKENDFPTTITYWSKNNQLVASIANDEMEILFEFIKLDFK